MSNIKVVDVIIRKTAEKTKLTGEGNLSVSISSPSVIEIQGSAQDVVRYVRQGKDLLIYMKDGSVIRCNNYFVEDPETHNQSELVFNDRQELTHISFADTGEASGVAVTELTAQATPISSIQPFLEQGSVLSDAPWGWIAGAALGGGAIGALLANGGDGETKTKVIDNTKEVESATPTFLLSDKAGDKQGVLTANAITDDNTPTFSGTGQPGATIQIKDSSGSTIASAMVGKEGTWTVKLPTQTDGEHTWSVVQIDGSKTTDAGNITVTVSTAEAAITLATTAGDNVLNASEQSAGFTLSGASKNLAQGTALTVTLNGKTYTMEVGADGTWSVNVPAADAQALGDGTWTVNVSGKDAAGNTVSGSQTIGVDSVAPTLSVDTLAQDNIINAAEHSQPLTLTGKTTAEAGQIVTVTLNGKNYNATVGSDGTWSVTLAADDVQALNEGNHTLTVNVSDKAGNGSSVTADFTVDTTAPVVTIDTVAGDDILNTSEQGQAQIISGQTSGASAGDVVTVTVGGQSFTGVVLADGSWSVGVPASVLGALGEGNHTISVSVTDAAGNTGSATHGITLSGNPPEFTIDAISQDNVLNAQEAMQPLSLTGTSNLPDGSAITVTLNNVSYQATVENGIWAVQVPVSDVLNLANTLYTVSVSGTDSVGNSGSAGATLLVDTVLPQVVINTFAGDNLVNNAEAGVDQTLSGRVTGAAAGDTVSVTVGGKSYTATVGSDLTWSVKIPSADLKAFGDGDLTFTASVTNSHGNTGTGERDININAQLPGLRVNTISGDDVVNAIEQQQDLTVTGASTHLAAGTPIVVTINNVEYNAVVTASGGWSIGVPAADLQAWTAGEVTVSVSAKDAWGNTVAAEHPIELDLNAVAVTIDTVSGDDLLNAAEKGADLTLSGKTQGVEAGQTVVVKFADQTFTAQVQQDGSWSLTVPASAMETLIDGRAQVSVSVTNVNGNSADASRVVTVDTLPPAITLDNLTSDNIINAAEAQQDLALSGTSTAEPGQTVTVTLNGKTYQTTVQTDGTWQLIVPAADVGALNDGIVTVTATVSDVAGNSSSADRVGLVDATVPQVTINDFVTDTNTVNQLAHAQAQILSGSVTGAAAGDRVTVTINSVDYTTVVDAAGNWSLGLPASAVQGLTDGTWTIDVSVTDRSGNTGSSSLDVVVNTVTPVIGINTLAVDDVINATEKGEDLLFSGTSNQPEGTTITVTLNGIHYTATADASGNWSVTVPAANVSALGEANYTVTANVTDSVGNSASTSHDVLVDSSLPVVTIDTLAGDNIVNAAEVAAGQTLTGKVTNAAPGDTVTITLGGQTFTATVQDDLTWSLPLTQSQLTALGNGDLTVSASVTNAHGNTGSSSLDFTIDAQLPGLRIDTVAGDDVINVIEHAQNLIVSGTSTDLAAGSAVTVTINGKAYSATVLADGSWQAAVPAADVSQWADGSLDIKASAQDASGNPVAIGTVVDVDLAPVAITISSVTDDNVLNAAEKGQDLVLSGTSSNVEAGQTVTIIFAGKTYTTTVDANGDWTWTVPAADLSGLKDGDASVQVSVTNVNGNAASSAQAFSVDTTAPTVTINTISGDNMLNAAEAAQDLTLSGTSTAEAGQTVTVTFNGNQYTAQVQADGSWTLDVPAADLAGITDGNAAVTATVSDKAGNPASAGSSVLVDTNVPQISFNIVAGDDIVNIAEHGQALIVSGKVTGAQVGDVITVTLNGKDYTAMLDASGSWSVGVPAADVGALVNGDQTISATLTDKAGNSTTATHEFDVSLTAPVVAINTLAADDVINATEKGQDLQVSGTSNQPEGTAITVTLNGINYTATTDASGNWSVTVPAANVSALGEASYNVTASVTDAAGNSASTGHSVLVDSALPQVTINPVATDDVINAAEVAAGQTLSGKVSGAVSGDTVTITLGGNTYTATVQDDLSWSVNVPSSVLTAIGNGDLTVSASVTNGHGNTGTGERDITIDANLPGLRVDTVAGDDVINSIEHAQNLIITGSSDGLATGAALTVTVNGKTYAATVLADGTWTAAIPAADVSALGAGTVTVKVEGHSAAGNPVSISHDVKVDLATVAISINPIASDDVVNAAEKGADLVLSGSTTNVEENQTVTITFGGKSYTATVDADGNWTATVPSADLSSLKDGDASVQVSVTNVNGNRASAGREYSVDTTAPTVSIEIISDNNIINAAEAQQDLVVNGVTNAEAGQTVTVTLNGVDYTTTVQANGSWSVTVPSADVGAITDGNYTISAAVSDKAGNPASADRDVLVDTTVPQLTIHTVSDDDVINSAEHAQALIVTGSVTGAAAGDVVTVTLNGKSYTATLDASGNWSVGVPAADVTALAAGDYTITAALTDKAGNSNSATHGVAVNLTAPGLTIDTVSGDDVINSTEKTQDLTLSGTASGLAAGAVVTVMLNGKAYSAQVDDNGKWTTTVPASEVGQLGEALYTVTASATDSVGNSTRASHTVNVESVLPGVIINTIAGDDVINAAELAAGQTISGKVVNAEAGNTVTVTIGGNRYTATVQNDLTWSVDVPESILTALGNGDLTVTASVTNGVGNSGSAERDITIDANLPGLRVDTVAGDDVINSIEHGQNLIVTGSSDGLTAGTTLTVTVNGKTYPATVLADGTWRAAIPAADVGDLAAGTVTVTVAGQSTAGNPVSISHDVTVDLATVAISIDSIAADDVINAAEKGADLVLSGATSNVEENQTVTITFGGKSYTATVDADGKWTTTVPAADLAGLKDGDASVQVSVTNVNGNSASAGREYSVDATAPTVTINTLATDDILNAAEAKSDLTVSGTSTAEAGQTVTVSLNGKDYTTTVSADGSWTLNVPAADLAGLTDGSVTVTASVSDKAGNPASVDHNLTVDVTVPAVTINTIAGDDVINVAEHSQAHVISGTATGAAAGDKVTVTIGGQTYTTVLDAAGNWSVGVPASVISGLSDGTVTVTASVTDAAGNTGTGSHNVTVDTGLPSVSFNAISDDNVLNAVEKGQDLSVSGTSANLAEGTVVTVTLNGKNYTATTAADGTWSLTVPAADLAGLGQANYTLNATATNGVGNSVSNTANLLVDTALPTVTINTVAGDNVINAAEVAAGQTLSGTVANAEAGNTVTVTIGGNRYTATVQNDLTWSVNVPSDVLTALGNGSLSVTATVTNGHGNTGTGEREIAIDANLPGLRVDTVAGDNVINGSEAAAGVAISGTTTAEAGQTVTVTLGGKSYTAQVQQGGVWSVNVPGSDLTALADSGYTVQVSVSDAAGNPGSAGKTITLDTTPPTVSFNVVAGDDVINSVEHGQAQIVSGSATGANVGDKVVITLGSHQYTTTVDASGNWSVGVPASVISALTDGTVTLSATITDSAGNSSTQTHDVVVNTASVALTVNTVSGDDVINAAEAGSSLVINGSSAQFASGTQVTVTLNGKTYTATIQSDGTWTTTVPAADVGALADGARYQVSVSAQDSAGNSASATHGISVDTTAPVVSIGTLSVDDMLNAAEAQQPLTVHGSSSAEAGQTVTVTLGGKTYTALVGSDGTWTLDVPAADLATLSQGALTVTASVNDKAGNSGQTTHTLTVDTVAPTVTISTVADDDIVNNAEQLAGQTIRGTTTAEQGQTVTVSFNGHSYQATVGADGSWSVFVPGRDFLGLSDGEYTITASVSDKAGNPGSATHDVTLNGDVPTITINTIAQDDIVNAAEHGTPLVISGTTDAPAGQTVTITLNGKTYAATVRNDGTWSYTVGSADVTALADGGSYVINAQVSNTIGNSASDNHTVTVDLTAPSMGISIDSLQNDTGLSATDFITNDSQVVVNGLLTAQLGNNEKAQISLDGGVTWIDLTVTGTTWRYADGRTLTDGTYQYQVRVIDNAGNVGATDSQDVVIDLTKPAATTITVDSITQDTGLSGSDFITSDNQISLKGTLGAALGSGDHAQISLDGGVTWIDVSVSGLSWTYVDGRTLADGDYNYLLRVIDDAGNISATASQVVTIDTVAPDASKTIAIDSISDDTGLSSSDFITRDTSLTLHGSLGATLADGEYAQISLDGGVTWQNVIVTGDSWYYVDSRTLGNQTYDYYVRVVDAAGNVGASAHQQVTVDTIAPDAAITVSVDNITVDTGFDNNDFLTSSTSYTLHGTLGAELGASEYVQVSMDGGTTWVYATVSGTQWSYSDTRTLTDGSHNYQVRVVDQAGNVGATTSQAVTVDTQAPQYGITIDSISDDTGQSGSDFITMDTTLTINGSLGSALASDERVQISLDGGNTWSDATVTNQRWSYTDTRDLPDGDYTYQVRIIDQAGNVGSTASQVVTVDTTPPTTVGTVVSYTDGEGERQGTFGSAVATDDNSPLINGTLNRAPDDGEIVQLYRDGVLLGQVTMNGSASWSFQDNGLSDGNHTYIVRVTDRAGNYTESDGFVLNVDTSIPTTTAAITAQTTSDTTPIVSGTVSADLVNGEYLVVTVNGKTYTSQTGGAVVVDPDHNTWYLQIPDGDALGVASYSVTAQVKSSAGNGNTTGTATGSLVIDTTSVNTDWATTAGNSNNSTMTLGMNSSGLWNIIANGQSYSSSDSSTYAGNTLTNTRNYYVVSQTAADFDRNGTQDIFATENTYAGSTQVMWTYDGSTYNASQLAMGTTIWYGGVIAYDKTGDGYLDLAYGDSGADSITYLINKNGVLSPDGTYGGAGFWGQFTTMREISGVDINNDGTVDVVQHTNRSGAYSLTVINNNGNGTLSIGQNLTNVFVPNASNTTTAASMTWADFNGDGYMDLYLGSSYNNNGGVIYYNDGTGKLSATKSAVEASNAAAGYLSVAVDWNGDGQMDIVKLSTYGGSQTATLFTNNGYGSTWTASQLASGIAYATGVAAVDYNWDGAQDLLVSQQNGKVVLVQNSKTIADGTAMHLHIVDSEGINAYYGNTVNLYNAAGVLVASQIINAQSGIGSNDTSALVSFYGLDPNETYSAEILKITNGVSDNVTWSGLEAGNGKEGYVLTAEAATGGHSGTITGTGYNDTFIAENGTYTYNGSGGWTTHSDHDTWSNTGGMDVVDYRNATSGVTVDLRLSTAQDTGFGTTRLLNIEGINGSDYDDVITGNSGDNRFEGRGGNDTFNIGSGGHDTLLYKLINASDATGGNGHDVVNGFTVGTWEGTADTDRIDLRDLLSGSGYTGTGSASYVNGVATLDSGAGNISDYIRVVQNGSNTEIQVDLDGTGGQFSPTTLVTLNGVQTDLATLLANHQLLIA